MTKKTLIDLTGMRFGRLKVLSKSEPYKTKGGHSIVKWRCICDCGNEVDVSSQQLREGKTQSCGCYRVDIGRILSTKHGKRRTRVYGIWNGMKQRCLNSNIPSYRHYGGRGITVCDEWLDKEKGSENFINWALKNGYKDNLSLDRINNNGNYCPENCRWTTQKEQCRNKRNNRLINHNGKIECFAKAVEEEKINYGTALSRILRGKNRELIFIK